MQSPNIGLFQNKYRIKSARLPGWDYSSDGYYFVTICVKYHECVFGYVENGEMILNELGMVAHQCFVDIPKHFPHAKCDPFVVMPNHVHGIIILDWSRTLCRDAINRVSTGSPPAKRIGGITGNYNPMGTNSLSQIIRWFKGRTTYEIRKNINQNFQWQSRFYDTIIKNDKSLQNIRDYIINNPKNWKNDPFNHN